MDEVEYDEEEDVKEDYKDEDFEVRKSGRPKKCSSRSMQLAVSAGGHRKRGRPPALLPAPKTCKECGKSFVFAKEYRLHCVRVYF